MPRRLTQKQEKFCVLLIKLDNASEAYRRAYDVKTASARTVDANSRKIQKHPLVAAKLASMRAKVLKNMAERTVADIDKREERIERKALLTREWVLERLMRNARVCMGEEKVKISLVSKASEDGSDSIPIEVEVYQRDAAQANKALELLGKTPEVSLFIAEAAGNASAPLVNIYNDPMAIMAALVEAQRRIGKPMDMSKLLELKPDSVNSH